METNQKRIIDIVLPTVLDDSLLLVLYSNTQNGFGRLVWFQIIFI